jgi:hypothetical protein
MTKEHNTTIATADTRSPELALSRVELWSQYMRELKIVTTRNHTHHHSTDRRVAPIIHGGISVW